MGVYNPTRRTLKELSQDRKFMVNYQGVEPLKEDFLDAAEREIFFRDNPDDLNAYRERGEALERIGLVRNPLLGTWAHERHPEYHLL